MNRFQRPQWGLSKRQLPYSIYQFIDNYAGSVIFSFMDVFYGYNQIEIFPSDQHKMTFICPWVPLPIVSFLWFENVGVTFQCAMYYNFHDIKRIVEPYLDDFLAHSKKQDHHIDHLRAIFLRCHPYNIRLNPHKCVLALCLKLRVMGLEGFQRIMFSK